MWRYKPSPLFHLWKLLPGSLSSSLVVITASLRKVNINKWVSKLAGCTLKSSCYEETFPLLDFLCLSTVTTQWDHHFSEGYDFTPSFSCLFSRAFLLKILDLQAGIYVCVSVQRWAQPIYRITWTSMISEPSRTSKNEGNNGYNLL